MSLQCPVCHKPVPAAEVNIVMDLGRCMACGEVFRPSVVMGAGFDPADAPIRPRPQEPPERTKVRIENQGGSLLVRFPSFGYNSAVLFLIAFAFVWWSFLLAFIGLSMSESVPSKDTEQPQEAAIQGGAI